MRKFPVAVIQFSHGACTGESRNSVLFLGLLDVGARQHHDGDGELHHEADQDDRDVLF